nr:hypothetical protein [Tanacetum cinerariifolium]
MVRAKLPELIVAQKNLEKPDAKIAAAREKKEQQNLAKAKAMRVGAGGGEAGPNVGKKHATTAAPEIAKDIPYAERVIFELSGNTRVSTPLVEVNQPSPPCERLDTHVSPTHDAHLTQSSHHGNEDELVANRYVPSWELCNDLRVCTFRTCKEPISHLATSAEDEFLGGLLNAEVISHAYQTLGQSDVAHGELLKRHEQLNSEYVNLQNCNDAHLVELDNLRLSLRKVTQDNEEKTQKITLLD